MFRCRICEATSSLSVREDQAIAQVFLADGSPIGSRDAWGRGRVSSEFLGAFVCCPFSTEVSMPILCPLAQPNKAIGLESHIGSWLALCLEPTLLLAQLHEPRASNHHRKHETDEI